jgi:hypothetical protein
MLDSAAQIHASTRQKYQPDSNKNKVKYFSNLFLFSRSERPGPLK